MPLGMRIPAKTPRPRMPFHRAPQSSPAALRLHCVYYVVWGPVGRCSAAANDALRLRGCTDLLRVLLHCPVPDKCRSALVVGERYAARRAGSVNRRRAESCSSELDRRVAGKFAPGGHPARDQCRVHRRISYDCRIRCCVHLTHQHGHRSQIQTSTMHQGRNPVHVTRKTHIVRFGRCLVILVYGATPPGPIATALALPDETDVPSGAQSTTQFTTETDDTQDRQTNDTGPPPTTSEPKPQRPTTRDPSDRGRRYDDDGQVRL